MLTRIRRSLALKTAVLFAAATLVPTVLAATLLFRSARAALYTEIVNGLDSRVSLMRDTLDARLAALRGNAVAWAGFEVMNDLLADDLDKRVAVVLEGLKRDYRLDGEIYAVGLDGHVIASSVGAAVSGRFNAGELARVRDTGAVTIDRTSPIDGLPTVVFEVPIRPRAVDRVAAILVLEYHLRDLAESVLNAGVPLAAVVRADGTLVATSARWAPGLEATAGNSRDIGGYIVARAAQRGALDVPTFGWSVMGAAGRDEVLAPITRVARTSLLVGLGVLSLLGILVAMAASRTVRPLAGVADTADRIAGTMDLSLRVPVGSEDEVGRVARAFNRMADEVDEHVGRLLEANIEMLEVLGSAIAKRDSDTSAHNYRVTLIALALAEARGLERPALQSLVKGSFLHDVGKIGISDTILLKPGRLAPEEFEVMKTHVLHGTDIVVRYGWLADAVEIVRSHHEKFGGGGYPDGLAGERIPLAARIFAIADVFDALTSERPYKKAMTLEQALATMRGDRATHFDPELFDQFEGMAGSLYERITCAPGEALTVMLQEQMRGYFFTAPLSPGAPSGQGRGDRA